ncbi:MAG TPA: hypothetical protein VEG30_10785 [Terriglobales bacterium]|nr:hypothetical protein [Terriglobales bacterium]
MAAEPTPFAKIQEAVVTVLDASGNVNQDAVTLNNGDQIYWTSTRGIGDCWIVFPSVKKSPLGGQAAVQLLRDGGTIGPFPIKGKKRTGYKYSVIGLEDSNDPTIIVDN